MQKIYLGHYFLSMTLIKGVDLRILNVRLVRVCSRVGIVNTKGLFIAYPRFKYLIFNTITSVSVRFFSHENRCYRPLLEFTDLLTSNCVLRGT